MSENTCRASDIAMLETLFTATAERNYDAVTTAVNDGFDVNARDAKGATLSMKLAASADNSLAACQLMIHLITHGADLGAQDNNGDTVMHHATRSVKMMCILIDAGETFGTRNHANLSSLDVAVGEYQHFLRNTPRSELRHHVRCGDIGAVRLCVEQLHTQTVQERDVQLSSGLEAACFFNNLEMMTLLRVHGAREISGALHCACLEGREEALRLMLSWIPEVPGETFSMRATIVNTRCGGEHSHAELPLETAAAAGHASIVALLLAAGAKATHFAPNEDRVYASISKAAAAGHVSVVKLLLERGVNVNAAGPHGASTALAAACAEGQVHMVDFLLEAGADMRITIDAKWIPLYWAASKSGSLPIVQRLLAHEDRLRASDDGLLAGYDFDQPSKADGRAPLHPSLDLRSNQHRSIALILAAGGGHVQIVDALFQAGADVNACLSVDASGVSTRDTALVQTCQRKSKQAVEVAEWLLTHGADVNLRAGDRWAPPLVYAAQQGRDELVELLLKHGANVNAPSFDGSTAVSSAASSGNLVCLRRLLQAGGTVMPGAAQCDTADIHLGEHRPVLQYAGGGDALYCAVISGASHDMCRLLLEHGACLSTRETCSILLEAIRSHCTPAVLRLLLLYGATGINDATVITFPDPNDSRNDHSFTPLLLACIAEDDHDAQMRWIPEYRATMERLPDVCRTLLEFGADVNAEDASGHTALWYIAQRQDVVACKVLLDFGAQKATLPNVMPKKLRDSLDTYVPTPQRPLVTPIVVADSMYYILPWSRAMHVQTPLAFRRAMRSLCLLRSRPECEPTWGCLPNEVFEVAVAIFWTEESLYLQRAAS